MAITSSPISTAANNIVKISTRSERALPKAQKEFQNFSRFLDIEVAKLERTPLPDKRKVKSLSNLSITSTFGSIGNLLSNLFSGGIGLADFVTGMFPGKGEKIGKEPTKGKVQPKPTSKGGKVKIGGVKALGVANAVLAGLDFTSGLSEGESVGKAASGAAGSAIGSLAGGALAGALLSGAVGQALVPVPGVGFVIGLAAAALGGFAGGYVADRSFETLTGEGKKKQDEMLKSESEKQKSRPKVENVTSMESFSKVLMKFNDSVIKFENFTANIGNIVGVNGGPPMEELSGEVKSNYDGENSNVVATPPNGTVITAEGGESPDKHFSSGYGWRWGRMHRGVDYAHSNPKAPITILQGGIADTGYESGYGNWVSVKHNNGAETFYGHLSKVNVSRGQRIEAGTVIGNQGSTGRSTGPHVHFEYRPGGPGSARVNGRSVASSYFRFGGNIKVSKPKPTDAQQKLNPVSTDYSSAKPAGANVPNVTPKVNAPRVRPNTVGQMATMPQNIMSPPPKPTPNVNHYTSYSRVNQSQSYIIDRETILAMGGGAAKVRSSPPVAQSSGGGSSGGGTVNITYDIGSSVLNSFMKSVLLTNLSAT
jgi:murein DD-endopeptidase MepM/ murein hydrolase activator NlpD